jgi:squalene-associated FAD-dependent desaturase
VDRVEDGARDLNVPVAVIGGGWAGCAAAVTLAAAGVPVTLYEAARVLGGRARRVDRDGLPLDNGQHLLLGAYASTLTLLRLLDGSGAARRNLARLPLTLAPFSPSQADALEVRARRWPGRLGLLAGLLLARGLTWPERRRNIAWFRQLEQSGFRRPREETVAGMLAPLPPRVARLLWEPLCLAALNTPVASASAQVFANVLRAALAGPREASDFLVPATDLGTLFPDAAARFLARHGGRCERDTRVQVVGAARDGVMLSVHGQARSAAAAIVAVGPHQLPRAFASEVMMRSPALRAAVDALQLLDYEPIVTVWLGYASPIPLAHRLARLDDAPGHWVFDRRDILDRATEASTRTPLAALLAVVISAGGVHLQWPHAELAQRVDAQLRRLRPDLPPCAWSWVVSERRATYACTPLRARPVGPRLGTGVYIAGDYVDAEFPATLEAAVRSGIAAAEAVLVDRR